LLPAIFKTFDFGWQIAASYGTEILTVRTSPAPKNATDELTFDYITLRSAHRRHQEGAPPLMAGGDAHLPFLNLSFQLKLTANEPRRRFCYPHQLPFGGKGKERKRIDGQVKIMKIIRIVINI
jgi:hypothetical protein